MAVDFAAIEQQVAQAISDLGERATVTVRYVATAPFDAAAPWEGPSDTPATEVTVEAVVTPFTRMPRDAGIDKTMNMARIFISGSKLSASPSIGDIVVLRGSEHRITNVRETRPGVTGLLWTLEVEL